MRVPYWKFQLIELNELVKDLHARGILNQDGRGLIDHHQLAFAYLICQEFGRSTAHNYVDEILRLKQERRPLE